MQKLLLVAFFCLEYSLVLYSQNCAPTNKATAMETPLISARLAPGGALFPLLDNPTSSNYLAGVLSKNTDGTIGPGPLSKAPEYPSDSLDIFPNPTTGNATLRYGKIKVVEARIFDTTGKLVQNLTNFGKGETVLKLGGLPAGMYNIRLFTDQGYVTKRVIVAR